jgi:translation initiation factor IF-3
MIPRGFPPRRPRIRENVNEAIRAREVRAVFPDGTVEVMPTPAAVRKAQDMGLDLILIAPTAEPPVAKAMDYGQWQYENKKKQHEAKKKQHVIQVKELKFRPNTDDHDYAFKKNHAIRFLQEGNRVKAVVQFRGREIAHTDLGRNLLLRFAQDLSRRPAPVGRPQCTRHHQPSEAFRAPAEGKRKAQAASNGCRAAINCGRLRAESAPYGSISPAPWEQIARQRSSCG